ncbi:MAG: carboxypeptidase regulatory-like domain-containing protein [Acidobacteriaceae bacterium]|nr:carboxypeptidase regulatory-like domain-containing protein [Acidobacteriaceae bacterium]MBV9442585.1 carboxypeptidase regulatory-like domain-containing protein [Acidobacteriaceae bacterium]
MCGRFASIALAIGFCIAFLEGQQACLVQGRVIDAQTGQPVRKAQVRLRRNQVNSGESPKPAGVGKTISDRDGNFCLTGNVGRGDYLLIAERAGYLLTSFAGTSPGLFGTVLALNPGQTIKNLMLALIPQALITGRVVDPDGEPVPSLIVSAFTENWVRGQKCDTTLIFIAESDLLAIYGVAQ